MMTRCCCCVFFDYEAMAWWSMRWIPNPGVPCSKSLDGSKVDSVFHPSEVGKISIYQKFLGI